MKHQTISHPLYTYILTIVQSLLKSIYFPMELFHLYYPNLNFLSLQTHAEQSSPHRATRINSFKNTSASSRFKQISFHLKFSFLYLFLLISPSYCSFSVISSFFLLLFFRYVVRIYIFGNLFFQLLNMIILIYHRRRK